MQSDFDLIIAGAGLAGNCLALALKNSRLKIAIVDAASQRELHESPAGDRALALSAGTVMYLEALNAWSGIRERATPIKRIVVSDRGHFGKTRLSAEEAGVDALGYVVMARDIEGYLAELAAGTSAHHFYETRIAGLMTGFDAINVNLKHQGKSLNLSAQLLVGADGGQSTVRSLLDIPRQVTEYGQTALVGTVRSVLPHRHTAYERFTINGPLALLPLAGKQSAVVWTCSHEQADALMSCREADFLQELQDCFGYRLGALALTAPRRAFPLTLVRAGHMVSGRAVLIGNAVHQLHPVAGQGFNLGVRDVAHLAETLLVQRQKEGDIGATDMLATYAEARQQDHDRTIGFTDNIVRIFSNGLWPLALARSAGLGLLDLLPGAKRQLVRYAMGLAGQMPGTGGKLSR